MAELAQYSFNIFNEFSDDPIAQMAGLPYIPLDSLFHLEFISTIETEIEDPVMMYTTLLDDIIISKDSCKHDGKHCSNICI